MSPRRGPRKLLLVLVSLACALPLAELGVRGLLWARGQPYDGTERLEQMERDLDTVKAFTPKPGGSASKLPADRVLHPFFGAESGADPGGVKAHFERVAPDDAFDVLVVGGSVAMMFGRDAGRDLERLLGADPRLADRPVRVLVGAHAAYKQPQQLNKVAYYFALGFRPDLVVNLDGFNEVAGGMRNGLQGIHPMFPSAPVWAGILGTRTRANEQLSFEATRLQILRDEYEAALSQVKSRGWMRSAILGTWESRRVRGIQDQRLATRDRILEYLKPNGIGRRNAKDLELSGDQYEPGEAAIVDLSVQSWTECSVSLDAMCRARGIAYLHALQPTLWDSGAKPMTEKEAAIGGQPEWRRGVQAGYPRLRAALADLEERGVATLDLSMAFAEVEEELYFDPCHFEAKGSKLLAAPIRDAILAGLDR